MSQFYKNNLNVSLINAENEIFVHET